MHSNGCLAWKRFPSRGYRLKGDSVVYFLTFPTLPLPSLSLSLSTTFCNAVADQDKTCATQRRALNPDKGDSFWKRRPLVRDRLCHAGRHLLSISLTLEHLSHAVAAINPLRLAWKTCNANSLALAMSLMQSANLPASTLSPRRFTFRPSICCSIFCKTC